MSVLVPLFTFLVLGASALVMWRSKRLRRKGLTTGVVLFISGAILVRITFGPLPVVGAWVGTLAIVLLIGWLFAILLLVMGVIQ